jgi:hypothetical protein
VHGPAVRGKNGGDVAAHDAAADDYCMFVGAGHFRFLVDLYAKLLKFFSIISPVHAWFVLTAGGMV